MRTLYTLLFLSALAFISVVFSACGRSEANDPTFDAIKLQFTADASRFGRAEVTAANIPIAFGTVRSGVCAECLDNSHIVVNETCWANNGETGQRIMLYHELGHCVLGLGHVSTEDIMNAQRISDEIFNVQPDVYLNRLFNAQSPQGLKATGLN